MPPILGFGPILSGPRGGTPALDPLAIFGANCVTWCRTDVGVTVSTGVVTAWSDQSSSGNDQNAGTGPAYNASGIGGLPDFTFDGTTTYLFGTSADLVVSAVTAWAIIKSTALNDSLQQFWGKGLSSTEWLFTGDSGKVQFAVTGAHAESDAPLNDGNPHVVVGIWDKSASGGAPSLYVDGVLQSSSVGTSTSDISGVDANGCGALLSSGAALQIFGYAGSLGEIGLANIAASPTQITQLNAWLMPRAGL